MAYLRINASLQAQPYVFRKQLSRLHTKAWITRLVSLFYSIIHIFAFPLHLNMLLELLAFEYEMLILTSDILLFSQKRLENETCIPPEIAASIVSEKFYNDHKARIPW